MAAHDRLQCLLQQGRVPAAQRHIDVRARLARILRARVQ